MSKSEDFNLFPCPVLIACIIKRIEGCYKTFYLGNQFELLSFLGLIFKKFNQYFSDLKDIYSQFTMGEKVAA